MTEEEKVSIKQEFRAKLSAFVESLKPIVQDETGQWTVKGFIDVWKNVYTISSDTKIVSKILEIHIFPLILKFADENGFAIVLAEMQNWYPDLSFVSKEHPSIKFAVDLKTSYWNPAKAGHINGFTLGSHGAYFRERSSTKNIQFPYKDYLGHYCLGIVYARTSFVDIDETKVYRVTELEEDSDVKEIGERQVTTIGELKAITSVIKNFDFFVAEKWEIASDQSGSGNTANIGSITYYEDIKNGNGVFKNLGEAWFDEYWINYGFLKQVINGKEKPITNLHDFLVFKGHDTSLSNKKKFKTFPKDPNQGKLKL